MLRVLLPAAAVSALALTGCAVGDGPTTAQTRDVAAFTRIDNPTSVDVRLTVGQPLRLRVRAGEKAIDDVSTKVRDGTLHLEFDHDGIGGGNVVVEASVPRLTGIESDGSGDVRAEGVDARTLDVRSDGSGDIELAGAVGDVRLDMDGSGDADLGDLTARTARISVGGSGDAEVRADRRLDVSIDGSGDVRYRGNPELTQRVDGSGDLTRAG